MFARRSISAAVLILAFGVAPTFARSTEPAPCAGCATPEQVKKLLDWQQQKQPPAPQVVITPAPTPAATPAPAIQLAPPISAPIPTPVAAPVTTAPPASSPVTVSSGPGGETTVSVGTLAGEALSLILSLLSLPIGAYVVVILQRVFTNLKIPMTDASRARIKQMAVNAVNLVAANAPQELAGHGNVAIRNAALAQAVQYVQTHGADDIKKLGLDPTSPKAQEAIRAWIETVINDPTTPTNPVMDPPPPSVLTATTTPIPPTPSTGAAA